MEIKYKHNKTKDEAYKAIDGFLSELKKRYKKMIEDYSGSWNHDKDRMDFNLNAMGCKISGKIQLYNNLVVLEGDVSNVPPLARLFLKSKIEKELENILS